MRHTIPSALMLLAATAFASAACSAQDADEPAAEPEAAASVDTDAEINAETSAEDEAAPPSAEATSDDADAPEADEPPAAEEPVEEAPAAEEEAAADDAGANSEYAALTGDAANGERVFRQCMACHTIQEGVNRVGPSLHGIIGREAGSVEGFRYSPANQNSGVTWTEETLFVYLENPREFIPGTFMAFAGLRDPQQRADVIAYLRENAM